MADVRVKHGRTRGWLVGVWARGAHGTTWYDYPVLYGTWREAYDKAYEMALSRRWSSD